MRHTCNVAARGAEADRLFGWRTAGLQRPPESVHRAPCGGSEVKPDAALPKDQPRLPLARYRLHFEAQADVRLPHFAGSTWRGALGHALKRLVCVTQLPQCARCALVQVCAHAYLFETPPPAHARKMRKYPAVPHPFVLNPPAGVQRLPAGAEYPLDLTLFGHGNRHLPYLIHALERAALAGLGRERAPLVLSSVERQAGTGAEDWFRVYAPGGPVENPPVEVWPIPAAPAAPVRLDLITPLRLRREGKPLRPEAWQFGDLFSNLLRRVSMLTYFHTDQPLETDFSGLAGSARELQPIDRQLDWRTWHRYSSRQKTTVAMDGLVGHVVLPANGLEPFWPYLWLGQYVHAGAGTSMGQGRYVIRLS